MAVLRLLSQESDFTSLRSLVEKLGGTCSDRSVRRWLSEMVREGVVEKFGNKSGTKYKIVLSPLKSTYLPFSPHSEEIVAFVRRPLYERIPVAYADQWIESYEPNQSFIFRRS